MVVLKVVAVGDYLNGRRRCGGWELSVSTGGWVRTTTAALVAPGARGHAVVSRRALWRFASGMREIALPACEPTLQSLSLVSEITQNTLDIYSTCNIYCCCRYGLWIVQSSF